MGVLVEIGRGRLPANDAAGLLTDDSGAPARLTAPASGLFLERVFYKGDPRGVPVTPVTPLQAAAAKINALVRAHA